MKHCQVSQLRLPDARRAVFNVRHACILESWATPRSAGEMLDGHHQRMHVPAHAGTSQDDVRRNQLEEGLCQIVPDPPLPPSLHNSEPIGRRTELT